MWIFLAKKIKTPYPFFMIDDSLKSNELKAIIENLKKENHYLGTIVSTLPEGVVAVDCQGVIKFQNQTAAELSGYSLEEVSGLSYKNILHFVNQLTSEPVELPLTLVCQSGKRKILFDHIDLVDRHGVARHVQVELAPVKQDDLNVLISFKDITGKNQIHEEINRIQKLDALSQLAGGIAHDFNNMLTGIMGMSELICRELETQEETELLTYCRSIIETCERASHVTDELLSFSRKRKNGCSLINLDEQILYAVNSFRVSQDRKVEVLTEFNAEHHIMFADPVQIRSIVSNLLQNAADALYEAGKITLITENRIYSHDDYQRNSQILDQGEYYILKVIDDGAGIDPEVLPHIFEPFFTTKKMGKGSGLGLSSIFGSVISHGGTVSVNSRPGKGALFEVALPLGDMILSPLG